jgi:hypothetical protein
MILKLTLGTVIHKQQEAKRVTHKQRVTPQKLSKYNNRYQMV